MANKKQLKILKKGVEEWNNWREKDKYLTKIDLRETDQNDADLRRIDFIEADLRGADLVRADLTKSHLIDANLKDAFLDNACIEWSNLERINLEWANLKGSRLKGTILKDAFMRNADLTEANLTYVNLRDANLRETIFKNANLTFANLTGADLRGADLTGADLTGADLTEVNLTEVKLKNTIVSKASFGQTAFGDLNLSEAYGLESCRNNGKSFIDFQTLQKSGKLPINFLRGCGLSDSYIDTIQSQFEQPLKYYYCFISHSIEDKEFAEMLYSDLQKKGIRVWYAPHDLHAGKKIIEQVEVGIKHTDKLLLILSDSSMDSNWVKTEITKAFKKSKEIDQQVLFPISLTKFESLRDWECFDSNYGHDLANEIREYHIPNFENWEDHKEYKKNFDKLVESLKIEADK